MNFWRDKSTLKLTAALFGIFLFLFFLITYISHSKFAPGEGLAKSVSQEMIVQFVTRGESPESLGIDAHLSVLAARVAYDSVNQQKVIIKNLSNSVKNVDFRVEIEPVSLRESVRWEHPWPVKLSLQAGEEKELPLVFTVNQARFKTQDGVLVFKILF